MEAFNENLVISGVWMNTANILTPRVKREQMRAGYLKMVGWMAKAKAMAQAYILKGGICGNRIPQTIWNFRRKIVWERKKYQDYTVCRANWRSFPLLMLSHCNKLSIKTLKHTIFSMKIPHWHQILVIFMIYALLSRNFDVRIYALFPQIFGNWKVESADFFTFRMYERIHITQRYRCVDKIMFKW